MATAYQLAQQCLEKLDFVYCLEEDKFYLYGEGIWKHIYDEELLDLLTNRIDEFQRQALSIKRQILDNCKTINHIHVDNFNTTNLLNLRNYMIDPLNKSVINHDKKYLSTIQLDYDYRDTLNCGLWLKTLNEIFEGNKLKIDLLQEFFGYCLIRDVRQEKALLLLGDSRSGKSTILHTLKHMIGAKNSCSIAIKNICDPHYTGMMVNKLICIDADVSAKAHEFEDEFKKITTGEEIGCSPKYVPTFTFTPYCKIVMSANDFPRITDHSSAFYKRLILIPCDKVFEEKEQNKNLRNQLLEELPGILNWAIKGLQKLNDRGRFEQSGFMQEAIEELREDSNPVDVFFREHVEIVLGTVLEKGELYSKYKKWSENNNQYTLSKIKFGICVFRKFNKQTPKNTADIGGKRIWRNLKYVDFKTSEIGWNDEKTIEIQEQSKNEEKGTVSASASVGQVNQEIDWTN